MASLAVVQRRNELYRFPHLPAVECLGCLEVIEIPKWGVVRAGGAREPIRDHPENLMLWLELQGLDHSKCASFATVEEAKQARQFRKERDRRKLVGAYQGRSVGCAARYGSQV